jgi:hypothetical protein
MKSAAPSRRRQLPGALNGDVPRRGFSFARRTREEYAACQHMTVRECADHLDVTHAAVRNMAKAYGLKFRPEGRTRFPGDGRERRAVRGGQAISRGIPD